MKKEHDEYLCKVYPAMFSKRTDNLEPIWFGFECGDGWFDIINMLCRNIKSYTDWNKDCPPVVVTQVKEKFGSLRFYYNGGNEYIRGLVSMAEAISEVTCEECGKPGKTRQGGWIKVLCDEHAAEAEARRKKRFNDDAT